MRKLKTVTLYDAGGFILVWIFFGLPLGIIFDYLWNLLVLWIALPRLQQKTVATTDAASVSGRRKAAYCLFITILGFLIDWAYFEMTWDMGFGKSQFWYPAMGQPLQILLIVVPIILLWLANFALSYAYLRLERRKSFILGGIMAVFTAPWVLPVLPYILGWVV